MRFPAEAAALCQQIPQAPSGLFFHPPQRKGFSSKGARGAQSHAYIRPQRQAAVRATPRPLDGWDHPMLDGLHLALKLPKSLDLGGAQGAATNQLPDAPPGAASPGAATPGQGGAVPEGPVVELAASYTPPFLRGGASGDAITAATLERWQAAYAQMTLDARQLGIPASAIPPLPQQPTQADLLDTRERLQGVVASFLSAGL